MSNPEAQWKKCDAESMVLFDEFANWTIKQNLDLDDDDDVTDSDIKVQNINRADQNYLRRRRKF